MVTALSIAIVTLFPTEEIRRAFLAFYARIIYELATLLFEVHCAKHIELLTDRTAKNFGEKDTHSYVKRKRGHVQSFIFFGFT